MKPLNPVELSAEDHRRILHWARLGAIEEIDHAENELARHLCLQADQANQLLPTSVAELIPDRFGGNYDRETRIAQLRAWLKKYRATFARFAEIERAYKAATIERDAEEIVASVLATRAAERKAGEEGKVVG